jgi:hypothetical protein
MRTKNAAFFASLCVALLILSIPSLGESRAKGSVQSEAMGTRFCCKSCDDVVYDREGPKKEAVQEEAVQAGGVRKCHGCKVTIKNECPENMPIMVGCSTWTLTPRGELVCNW